jgi:hypothetical protein
VTVHPTGTSPLEEGLLCHPHSLPCGALHCYQHLAVQLLLSPAVLRGLSSAAGAAQGARVPADGPLGAGGSSRRGGGGVSSNSRWQVAVGGGQQQHSCHMDACIRGACSNSSSSKLIRHTAGCSTQHHQQQLQQNQG